MITPRKHTKQGSFLSSKYASVQHIKLGTERRATLHDLLKAAHRAVFVGRADLAIFFAETTAKLCTRGGCNDTD